MAECWNLPRRGYRSVGEDLEIVRGRRYLNAFPNEIPVGRQVLDIVFTPFFWQIIFHQAFSPNDVPTEEGSEVRDALFDLTISVARKVLYRFYFPGRQCRSVVSKYMRMSTLNNVHQAAVVGTALLPFPFSLWRWSVGTFLHII
jgi:hypothetical protein